MLGGSKYEYPLSSESDIKKIGADSWCWCLGI